jgi:predicted DNA binding CopG/RHH family protein
MKKLKKIPHFKTAEEEGKFWLTHDTTDYVDWSKAKFVRFPNLKRSTESISIRLPEPLLSNLRAIAKSRDVPYQSLLKVWLAERLEKETVLVPFVTRSHKA